MKTKTLRNIILSCIIFCGSSYSSLKAEIESITIKWTALECQQSCIAGLEKQFRNINGVADVIMNQPAGMATLRWKPDVVLTFPPINTAMSMIGLSINDLRVKVRGTISHDARTVTINSLGDNTRFLLMSPVTPKRYEMVEEFNPETHILTPSQRDQFLQAQDADQVAIVEGPLFEPERSPPLKLIVANVKFIKAEGATASGITGVPGISQTPGTTGIPVPTNLPWGSSDIPFQGVSGLPR
jgi:hypothetical protein